MPGPDRSNGPHDDRGWLILAVIGIAQLVVVLDMTIVNIALPSAEADLGFSDDERQWGITASALSFGGLLLLGGWSPTRSAASGRWSPVCSALQAAWGWAMHRTASSASAVTDVVASSRATSTVLREAAAEGYITAFRSAGGRDLRARCAGLGGPAAIERAPGDGARRAGARGGAGVAATTTETDRPWRADLANAGGGLSLGIIQLAAIIPGFLPALILTVALVAVVVVPLMALGLLGALVAALPYGLWRLAARHRQGRSEP